MDFLIIDDDKTFRDATCFLIEEVGHYAEGVESGQLGLSWLKEDKWDAVLLDVNLGRENGLDVLSEILKAQPQVPVVMFTAQGSVKVAVEAMRRGAVDFLEKPFQREQFTTVLGRLQRLRQLSQRIVQLEQEVTESRAQSLEPIFDFTMPLMRDTMEVLGRAARTPASILLLGESGTGKSVTARAVHRQSHLADKPFVTVSCPSLSRELLESELFGHVKGSFTGAIKDHWGKVKAAEGGTLFLDEIGDLPLEIQPKLLRLLQEREYERLGENVTRTANLRIIAATNRDLKRRVAEGLFREDLYFRLNVIAVEMPPLRSRRGSDPVCGALPEVFCGAVPAGAGGAVAAGHRVHPGVWLAGEPAGIAQRHRTGGHPGQARGAAAGRFSRGTAGPKRRPRRDGGGGGAADRFADFPGETRGGAHAQDSRTHAQPHGSRRNPGHRPGHPLS